MKRPSPLSLLWHQARYEWRIFWRTPISAFFTIFFPLLIFVVFSLVFGNERIEYLGITTAQFYAPSLAVFAAVSATYTNISIFTSYQRDEGILKRVRGTPLPSWVFFGGKILSSILIALIGTLIMLSVGVVFFGLQVYPGDGPDPDCRVLRRSGHVRRTRAVGRCVGPVRAGSHGNRECHPPPLAFVSVCSSFPVKTCPVGSRRSPTSFR